MKEQIDFAIGTSDLGLVLVALSDMGVAAIMIEADRETLSRRISDLFPKAELHENAADSKLAVKKILAFIATPAAKIDLSLDMRGTPFQQKVWTEIMKIPPGKTSTYTDIARKIGAPRAMRAVGSACKNSHFSFVVPCHRVTKSDGTYSNGWPGDGQRILLEREAIAMKAKRTKSVSRRSK